MSFVKNIVSIYICYKINTSVFTTIYYYPVFSLVISFSAVTIFGSEFECRCLDITCKGSLCLELPLFMMPFLTPLVEEETALFFRPRLFIVGSKNTARAAMWTKKYRLLRKKIKCKLGMIRILYN